MSAFRRIIFPVLSLGGLGTHVVMSMNRDEILRHNQEVMDARLQLIYNNICDVKETTDNIKQDTGNLGIVTAYLGARALTEDGIMKPPQPTE